MRELDPRYLPDISHLHLELRMEFEIGDVVVCKTKSGKEFEGVVYRFEGRGFWADFDIVREFFALDGLQFNGGGKRCYFKARPKKKIKKTVEFYGNFYHSGYTAVPIYLDTFWSKEDAENSAHDKDIIKKAVKFTCELELDNSSTCL